MTNTEILKEQIAETYIKDFKKELGFLEWVVLSSMHKKLINLITAKEEIWENITDVKNNRFVDKLVSWFPETADKIYTYIKNKRIELQKMQTFQELENLKAKIAWEPEPYPDIVVPNYPTWSSDPIDTNSTDEEKIEEDEEVSSVTVGLVAAGGSTALGTTAGAVVLNKSKEAVESAWDVLTTKKSFDTYAETLRSQLKNPKLSSLQKGNIEKNIKVFEDAISWINGNTLDALKAWKQVGTEKLSADLLKNMNLDTNWFTSLQKILDNTKLADQLYAAKDITEMKSILKANKLSGLSDEVLMLLKSSKDIHSFRNITVVLAGSRGLLQVSKAVFVAGVFDLAFIGLDAYIWRETRKEADIIAKVNAARANTKRTQADTHLAIGMVSGLASAWLAIAGLVAGWPPWWVVLVWSVAIGAVAATLDHSLDASYFDIKDFYLQNFEENKKKLRAELKASLIQVINGIYTWSVSVADPITIWLWAAFAGVAWAYLLPNVFGYAIDSEITDELKFRSLDDLLKALIYIEQIDKDTFAILKNVYDKWLTGDQVPLDQKTSFDVQKNTMDTIVSTRVKYLQAYMPQKKWDQKAQMFLWGTGISTIESLMSKSRAVYDMSLSDAYVKDAENVDAYLSLYDAQLQKEDPIAYKKLSDLLISNPTEYAVLYAGVENYASVVSDAMEENPTDPDYIQLDVSISYRKKFEQYQSYIRTDELYVDTQTVSYNMINYDYLHYYLNLLSTNESPKIPNRSQEQVFDNLTQHTLYWYEVPVSDHPLQNILYRIAREVYGANVSNDWLSLLLFYQESRDDVLGIYYGNRWYDWSANRIVNDDYNFDEIINPTDFANLSAEKLMEKYFHMNMIDSAAENADKIINKELYTRFENIVKEELWYRVESNRDSVKKNIENYIMQHVTDGYIELPYNMTIQAVKSWLWHVEKFVYTVRDGKIYALTLWSDVDLPLWIDVQKESTKLLRENLSNDEHKVISYVDAQFIKLNTLLSIEWDLTSEDELDLTREHELLIRQKVKDWQDIVQKLPYMQPLYAKQLLESSYKEYAVFFSRMYTALLVEAGNNSNWTNDVDRSHEIQSVFFMIDSGFYTIESWVVKLNNAIKLPSGYDAHFDKIISTHKTQDGRSIKELLISNKPSDTILWSWYIEQLINVLIGKPLLRYDKNGKLIDINWSYQSQKTTTYDGNYYITEQTYSYDTLYNSFIESVKEVPPYLVDASIHVATDSFSYDETSSVSTVNHSTVEAMETAHDVTKQIESTSLNVVRQGRKDIVFDHSTGDVASWSHKTAVDIENLSLNQLDSIKFSDMQELLWVANFVNRVKYFKTNHDKWNKIYWWSRGWLGIDWGLYFADSWFDTQLITIDSLKKNAPSLLDGNNDINPSFEGLLNKI